MNKLAITLTVLAAALPVAAQGLDNEFPFTGTITGNGVIVRTTPLPTGTNSVTRLVAGAEVTVYGRNEGWLKIKPPAGCFSIVPRYAVTKDADGAMGTLTDEKPAPVFAGSNILPPPWPYQMRLPKGTRVQVLGEYTDEGRPFLKIAPPEGVYMYVPARNVQKAGGALVDPGKTEGPLGGAVDNAKDHTAPPVQPVKPPVAPVDPKMEAARAALAQAEATLKAELAKPSGKQDLDGLMQKYQALKEEHGSRVGFRIDAGMRAIAAAAKRKQAISELENRFRTVNAIEAEPVPQWRTVARTGYAACGTLAASEIFGAADGANRRFAIHDPSDPTRILAYVQDATGTIDFSRYIGKNVGIVGTVRNEPGASESLIDAREVVELGAGAIPGLTNPILPGAKAPAAGGAEGVGPAPADQPVDTSRLAPGEIIVDPGAGDTIRPQPVRPAAPVAPPAPTAPVEQPRKDVPPASTEPPAGFKLFKPDEGLGSPVNPDEYK